METAFDRIVIDIISSFLQTSEAINDTICHNCKDGESKCNDYCLAIHDHSSDQWGNIPDEPGDCSQECWEHKYYLTESYWERDCYVDQRCFRTSHHVFNTESFQKMLEMELNYIIVKFRSIVCTDCECAECILDNCQYYNHTRDCYLGELPFSGYPFNIKEILEWSLPDAESLMYGYRRDIWNLRVLEVSRGLEGA